MRGILPPLILIRWAVQLLVISLSRSRYFLGLFSLTIRYTNSLNKSRSE